MNQLAVVDGKSVALMPRRITSSLLLLCAVLAAGFFAAGCQPVPVTLSGTVTTTAQGGAPQLGIPVRVYADATEALVATAYTNDQGQYQFDSDVVPDGTYRVKFADTTWWQGATTWADATPVAVSATTPATIDSSVTVATGNVTGTMTEPDIAVIAFDKATGQSVATAVTVGQGFTITGLPVGTYTFGFVDPAGIMRSLILGTASLDPSTGDAFTVTAGATLTVGPNHDTTKRVPIVGRDCLDSYAGADLSNVNFTDAILINCDFTDANLTDANVTNADFTGANLRGVRSSGIVGIPAALPNYTTGQHPGPFLPNRWILVDGYIVGPDANLAGADLAGADLSDSTLTGAHFNNADLSGANLHGALIPMTDFTGADLSGADLTGLDFFGFTGFPAIFNGADLSGADATSTWFRGSSFVGTNLTGANLTGTDFQNSDLTNANLTNATMAGTQLTGATLTGATLTGVASSAIAGVPASLPDGWMLVNGYLIGRGANLSGATLGSGSAEGAVFTDVDLSGADLTHLGLTGVSSGGIIGTPVALPVGWRLVNGYLIGFQADLADADLTGANLTGAAMNGVTLTGATLTGADLTGANLMNVRSGGVVGTPLSLPSGWKLVSGYLIGPWADLSGADLAGLNLTGVKFTNSNLAGINLSDSNVSGVKFTNANLTGANLAGANLTNANLTGTNFTSVDLTSADLSNANLTSVTSSGIIGTPNALPAGWKLFNGYLIGPGAKLPGANLTGADLSSMSLVGADLTGSYLTGANLTGTDLSGATLTSVTSSGIIGTPAQLPPGWKLLSGYLVGPGANLSFANLTGGNLVGMDLTGANLLFTNLTNVDLAGANLTNVNLTNTNLTGATLTGVISSGITGTPAALPAGWTLVGGVLVGP